MTTLGYALLGLLAREPLTGYQLTSRIKERVGPYWSTSHSQVYPALASLEAKGQVTHHVVEQRERPDKKVFSITEGGLESLRQWVVSPITARPARDELILRAYCVWVVDPATAATLFREHQRRHEAVLADYQARAAWMTQTWGDDTERPSSPSFASYATIRRGIGYEREYADWCRWLAERLEAEDVAWDQSDPGVMSAAAKSGP